LGLDWSLIQSQFIGQLKLGEAIQSQYPALGPFLIWSGDWMISKCEARSLQLLSVRLGLWCDADPDTTPFWSNC
jgi:hypothetical protein